MLRRTNPILFVIALHTLLCIPLFAQQIEIKLVDGRNGHPMQGTGSHLNVWVGTERKDAIVIPTEKDGTARIELTIDAAKINIPGPSRDYQSLVIANPVAQYNESLRINVPYALCITDGSNYSWLATQRFSTKQILQQGYVSPNTCGKISIQPKPGQIIIFARPLTWLEQWKE
jgi:hypothetical protein